MSDDDPCSEGIDRNGAERSALFQKLVRLDASLPEYSTQRALRHVTWMVGDGGVATRDGVVLNILLPAA